MYRHKDALIQLEEQILSTARALRGRSIAEFHGYQLATEIEGRTDGKRLVAHGTLYRALDRLEGRGFLQHSWLDNPEEGRPRRKMYRITESGIGAIEEFERQRAVAPANVRPGYGTVPT